MKILQAITLADLGGAQSVLINLSNKAVENGHEVYVVSEQHGTMWNLLSPKIHKIKIKEPKENIHERITKLTQSIQKKSLVLYQKKIKFKRLAEKLN